ncbi:MAG: family 20 glycosylhydrolase [Actinomycetaceae bacterium]|nr:family 20 glycosylhydrolase [Actinomycetaceae bacterium]
MRRTLVGALGAILLTIGLAPAAVAEPADDSANTIKNLAMLETTNVFASGHESGTNWAEDRAVDGDNGTDYATRETNDIWKSPDASRWSANTKEPPVWLALNFGGVADIAQVNVTWGRQFATEYQFQQSEDGVTWTNVGPVVEGVQSETVTTELGIKARYLRLNTLGHRSQWPVSIWEIEVMGTVTPDPIPEPLPPLIPKPASYAAADGGDFVLSEKSDIVASGDASVEAEALAKVLRTSTGFALPVVEKSTDPSPDIVFEMIEGDEGEAYSLETSSEAATILAGTQHGLFNGGRTLLQLLGPWSVMDQVVSGPWSVQSVKIEDSPRFAYRGIMLDPARSFFTVDEVKQAIDVMANYKFSYLHLHLTDDQGWRIEITNEGREEGDTIDYTRLTTIGGATAMGATERTTLPGVVGYYTQDDLRDIVAYAAQRHITVLPEVDMPGHSGSILHSIPQLNTPGSSHDGTKDASGAPIEDPADYIVAPAQSTGAVGNSYLDPASEQTWMFLRHVVKQVGEITGSQYFHVGGDETHKMDQHHPGKAVQFLREASAMVRDLGMIPVGWHEWAPDGKVPNEGDVMQLWNGNKASFATGLTEKNGKAIYSHASNLYFPQKAGPGIWGPTWACGGACGLPEFYNYDPAVEMNLSDDQILGIEGAMWNEHVRSIQDFFYPAFPRAMAAAEVGWTPQAVRNNQLNDLKGRIVELTPALTVMGVQFYDQGLDHKPLIRSVPNDGSSTLVGFGYSPNTAADAVSAQLTLEVPAAAARAVTRANDSADGATGSKTFNLETKSRLEYRPSNEENNNDRAQAGLWELHLSQADLESLPEGVITGSLSLTNGSTSIEAEEVPVAIDKQPAPEPAPEPEPEPEPAPEPEPEPAPSGEPSGTGERPSQTGENADPSATVKPSDSQSEMEPSKSATTPTKAPAKSPAASLAATGTSTTVLAGVATLLLLGGTTLVLRRRS